MSSDQFRDEEIRFLNDQRQRALDALAQVEDSTRKLVAEINSSEREKDKKQRELADATMEVQRLEHANATSATKLQTSREDFQISKERIEKLDQMTKILEDEIRDLELNAKVQEVELQRLEKVTQDHGREQALAEESVRYLDNELRKGSSTANALREEKQMLQRLIIDAREQSRRELEELERAVTTVRERNAQLCLALSEKEAEHKRAHRERCQLEDALAKERNELKLLDQLKRGNAVEDDATLREKQRITKQIAGIEASNAECITVIGSVDTELKAATEQGVSLRNLIRESEAKIVLLNDQSAKLQTEKDAMRADAERLGREIAAVDVNRSELIAAEERAENLLSGQLRREMSEETRSDKALSKKLDELDYLLSEGTASLAVLDKRVLEVQKKLKATLAQNEFMQHQIDSYVHAIGAKRQEIAELNGKLSLLVSSDRSANLESKKAENDKLVGEIEKHKLELKFLTEHGMIGPDGLLKPLQIDNEGTSSSNLIDRLGINDFLLHAQSNAEVGRVCLALVEKTSELLEMIHNAETLEARYLHDVERTSVMMEQLAERNAEINAQVANLKEFRQSALVQMGLNQAGSKRLILTGLGFTDADLDELFDRLTQDDKAKIEAVLLGQNGLVDFSLVRLVTECLALRHIDVTQNPIETINELERYLRNKVEGITSVFRDAKLLISNSGLQVRLTVQYA